MFARCELPGTWKIKFYSLSTKCFRGVSYGLEMTKFVICPTCEKLGHKQRPKGCITFALTLIGLRLSAANPTIDHLPHRAVLVVSDISMSLFGFCFGQYLVFSCTLEITHHVLVNCKWSVPYPDQRATTAAMPCSSVSRGEYTLTLGQV